MTILLAQSQPSPAAIGWGVVLASLSLVLLALGLARWLRLGVERELIEATLRAAVQLLAVGVLFGLIFGSAGAVWWAWLWVAFMVVVATGVVRRRARYQIRHLTAAAAVAVLGATAISLTVSFGFGVFEFDPVALVVVAGITIGNAVPSTVLGVNQSVGLCRDRRGDLEALLSLGFDARQAARFMAPRAARSALIPQVERTKVVGLIALPGAMTGLLLAGVDPAEAVVIQLLVMYLVLGTVAVCVVAVVATITRAAFTSDLRVADWVLPGSFDGDPS